jgi:uncharacterized BrkB/YihY/UPF0761 family membrane protein
MQNVKKKSMWVFLGALLTAVVMRLTGFDISPAVEVVVDAAADYAGADASAALPADVTDTGK